MNNPDLARLNRMLAREASSLLQYLGGAWPWTTEPAMLDRLRALQGEQAKLIRKLGDFLLRRRSAPAGASYPEEFTTLHFVGLDHLLPRLMNYQRWLVENQQPDATGIADGAAAALAAETLETDRRHLAELEQLASQLSNSKVASTLK